MKPIKWITGIVLLIVGVLIVLLLAGLIQQLLISGTEFIDDLGGLLVESDEFVMDFIESEDRLGTVVETEEIEEEPVPTFEPVELVEIPIEETPEELAQEYQERAS